VLSRGPGQSRFTLAVLVVISVTVLAIDLLGIGPLDAIRHTASGILSPVRAVGDAVFGDHDGAEVNRLRDRVAELEGAEAELANAQAELARLRQELTLAPPEDIRAVAAEIVGRPVSNFDLTIEIDKGADAGIEPGMPVQTRAGLVGVVDTVSFNSARIQLITDPDLQVGVLHSLSADLGIAHGQGQGRPLLIENAFDVGTVVAEGDLFVTAGRAGSAFPPDIPVGTAIAVHPAANPLEQEVVIEPLADLDRLTHVAVLLYTAPPAAGAG
jgi:rod shape-determining protein MreC